MEKAIRMGLIQHPDENSMSSKLKVPLIKDDTMASNKGNGAMPNIRRLRNVLRV